MQLPPENTAPIPAHRSSNNQPRTTATENAALRQNGNHDKLTPQHPAFIKHT